MTSDGKEIVTASRLVMEVKEAVRNAGGRASLRQLVSSRVVMQGSDYGCAVSGVLYS